MRLAERVKELRAARGITLQQVGERMGVTRSAVWDWEKGRSQIPSAEIPRLASVLGVTICDLYGVNEGHEAATAPPMTRLAQDLASALAVPAEKIEIHVHHAGEWQLGQSVEGGEFQPTRADRGTRRVLERWEAMTEQQRERLLAFADDIKREESGEL